MHPSEQIKLYGLDKYIEEIIKLYELKKMPNKILLSGKKGTGKSTLAYHLINYVFSQSEELTYNLKELTINNNNRSFKLVKNNTHPNFYLIDLINEKKNIEINQIRDMITYTNKSSFNEQPRFILINNVENLNKNSTNALLKVVEEPNNNVFFILIHDTDKFILPTLKSRCLTFKINLTFDETINISNFLLNENLFNKINYQLVNYYSTPGELINLINFSLEKKISLKDCSLKEFLHILIDNNYYKKNKYVRNLIIDYIELYFLQIYKKSDNKNNLINFYYLFINKINDANKFNLDEESLFMEFKSELLNV
jgi:DNA polymerase III subunit delta'